MPNATARRAMAELCKSLSTSRISFFTGKCIQLSVESRQQVPGANVARFSVILTALEVAAWVLIVCPAMADDLDLGVDAWERGDYSTAYQEWKSSAEQGDSDAQYNLGSWYYHVEQDYANAVQWLREAAQQGHPLAQHDLGSLYALGFGVSRSDAEAAKWYALAADQGHPMAQYNLGASFYSGEGVRRDYSQAAVLFREAAVAGIAMAQNNLGVMYLQGLGVRQDHREAAKWFRSAAEQSVEEALSSAGAFHRGRFGSKAPVFAGNYSPTMEMYREGVGYVLAGSKATLGYLYEEGLGVPRDFVQAYTWYHLAVESLPPGETRSSLQESRHYLGARMTPTQVTAAQRMAREWLGQHRTEREQ